MKKIFNEQSSHDFLITVITILFPVFGLTVVLNKTLNHKLIFPSVSIISTIKTTKSSATKNYKICIITKQSHAINVQLVFSFSLQFQRTNPTNLITTIIANKKI